ncbi:MAG: biopolymer transporter ExbD [Myxococcales bacterium]|nr:biopolymer transporter ExbD [Myxococcales bacterium]MCB9691027.1 biopolymer transporter ExbD [Alphaproteobacteria bacterium]
MLRRPASQTPLDLIPIMGLMTLLIPLLLVNQSSGLAFATVDADLPAGCACGSKHDGEAKLIPTVALGLEHITVQGEGVELTQFAADDLQGLGEHLAALKEAHATDGKAIIVPESRVAYQELISVMDTVRPHFPVSTLAGGVE